ncbi:MAG: hypothetical protein JST31_10450 [Actinobacteria bacterium]|nr:hypothetical protein [Actinomycetota bacterium]
MNSSLSWRSVLAVVTVACLALAASVAGAAAAPAPAPSPAASPRCPNPGELLLPSNPRGAIPAAKAALGSPGRVLEVRRGPGSTYAAAVKRVCGAAVLRKSVYVNVHPLGMRCSACNLHAYVVQYDNRRWEVWTAY